jgi:hypothetical protein
LARAPRTAAVRLYDVLGAFTPIAAPTRAELETLCTTIAERVQRLLERRALDHDHADERAVPGPLSLGRTPRRRQARSRGRRPSERSGEV